MREALVVDLGTIAYAEALALQRRLAAERHAGTVPDVLLLCQHPPVVTLGRSGDAAHIGAEVRRRGVPVYDVERGGDVTYHGPGQLVGYPVLALRSDERDLHGYLRGLEEVVLRTLADFGVHGERLPGLTGVWSGKNKLCAIGVAVRHWVTLHGFALNVNLDLQPFQWIVPCGLHGRGVTSLEALAARPLDFAAVQAAVVRHFGIVFSRSLQPAAVEEVLERLSRGAAERGVTANGDDGDLRPSGRNGERQPE
ncbi:MAG: lipoyl(octanoyl) transferase LipB [Armatimonadetes bacterium]|nr:lipoyl(octanoyl) transferase LipB [Armatimonadota bacterium]